ncbi:MAG: peptidase domain-containing ABC transporter [Bacteroidales bacterium]|nr:peptidase domain-containing ABC transporter [Bacteroidales bacterium]
MKRLKGIRQHDISDCAAACVAAISEWYGLELPIITVREVCGSNTEGTSMKGVIDGCKALGLDAKGYKSAKKEMEALRHLDAPAILHIVKENGDLHFVVLCGTSGTKFDIMDPAVGKHLKLRESELQRLWSGYILLIFPSASFVTGCRKRPLMDRLLEVVSRHQSTLFISVALSILYIATGVGSSFFLQQFVDNVIPNGDIHGITITSAAMLVLIIIALFSAVLRLKSLLRCGYGIDHKLITEYIRHLFRLPAGFFALRGSGELNSRIGDAMNIRTFITTGLTSITISVMTLIFSFALMFSYYWKLALFTLMFMPAYIILYSVANSINNKIKRQIIESSASFEEKCVENIAAMKTIKFCCSEEAVSRMLEGKYGEFSRKLYRGGHLAGYFSISSDMISRLLTLFILAAGSIFILKGALTVGELVSFYSMATFFSSPLSQIVELNDTYAEAKVSASRLFEILDMEEERYDGAEMENYPNGIISFNDVTFNYPGRHNLLENFNASIYPGEITAIIGKSGCGKSSLAALLMRTYSPIEGNITLNGIDISWFGLQAWRGFVSIVPQESILMNCSILDNITGWDSNPNLERVAHLLAELDMAEMIKSLPGGLMAHIGERGGLLSGGQKQRIALARALYKEPKVLILDEATSSLDYESEQIIMNKILSLKKEGLSIIMITHKRENISIADNIIEIGAHRKGDFRTP